MKKKKTNAKKKSIHTIVLSESRVSRMEVDLNPSESDEPDTPLNVVQCRNFLYDTLIRNGSISILKSHLSDILRFAGWNRLIRGNCFQYIKNEGMDTLNISHMIREMIPHGRSTVPEEIRESLRTLIRNISQSYVTIDDSKSAFEETSDTYLELEYQTRDKLPDYGDQSVLAQPPDTTYFRVPSPVNPTTPILALPGPEATATSPSANSPGIITRDIGAVAILDRVDRDKENETERERQEREKSEQREREKEKQDRDRIRQELEKERLEKEKERERHERERQEQRERERQEQKDRERLEKDRERHEQKERERTERRERHNIHQSLSVPSSPSTPRPDKKNSLAESAVMMKLTQVKQPPSLASTLITATAAIAGKKSKHINLNSDNDDDDEDDEELMDI